MHGHHQRYQGKAQQTQVHARQMSDSQQCVAQTPNLSMHPSNWNNDIT